jgi:hypothetical protein
MIGVSSSYAFAALFLTVGLIFTVLLHLLRALPTQPTNLPANFGASLSLVGTFFLVVGPALFIIAGLPSVLPSRFSRMLSLLPAFFFIWGTVRLMRGHLPFYNQLAILAALLFSALTDMGLLAGVRQSIRWISEDLRPRRICLVILAQIGIVVFVLWAPVEVAVD